MPLLTAFPAFHKVAGRTVLIVGSGAAAAAKARLLGETEARLRVVAEAPDAELTADLARSASRRSWRASRQTISTASTLAFAATEDEAEDRRDRRRRARGARAGQRRRPPGTLRFHHPCAREPRAARGRDRHRRRGPGARAPCPGEDRGDAVARDSAGSPRSPTACAASWPICCRSASPAAASGRSCSTGRSRRARFAGDAAGARSEAMRMMAAEPDVGGFVWLVGAGPGATDLLTLRAQSILQEADVIVHDALVPLDVVAMGRRDAAADLGRQAQGPPRGEPGRDRRDTRRARPRPAAASCG